VPDLDVLDGVDDIPWPDLRHAYGAAGDVPALLRALVLESGEAGEAFDTLWGSICHQGSVYSATPYAVPFLARIAAAGIHTVMVLGMLGWIADSDDERGLEVPGAARAAVASQIAVLAPLLADRDAEVRAMTVWALTQCQAPDRLVPLLRQRWNAETHPTVKATVLKALSVLDPQGAAGIAEGVLAGSAGPGVRLIAAAACVAAGMGWPDRLHDAAMAWMAEGELLPEFFWGDRDPFADLVITLAARGNPRAALGLVVRGLTGTVAAGVRKKVVWAADELAEAYRSPAAGLVAPLAVVAGDDDAGPATISLLRKLAGVPATARQFTAIADQLAAVADVRGPGRRADQALACLIELGGPRPGCSPVTCRTAPSRWTRRHPRPVAGRASRCHSTRPCLRRCGSGCAPRTWTTTARSSCSRSCPRGARPPNRRSQNYSRSCPGTRWAPAARWPRSPVPFRPPSRRSARPRRPEP